MKIKSHFSFFISHFPFQKGFTLIELLIVIAILGVLAAGVLVAIDPVEQLNRGRDSSRKSAITQLGRAIQAYYTSQNALPLAATWDTALTGTGDIKVFPVNPTLTAAACTTNVKTGYCYLLNGTVDYLVYSRLDSKTDQQRAGCAAGQTWFAYDSTLGKAGLLCKASELTSADHPTVF